MDERRVFVVVVFSGQCCVVIAQMETLVFPANNTDKKMIVFEVNVRNEATRDMVS